MRMAKEKAYLSGRIWCADLLENYLSAPLDCEVILMTLLPTLRLILSFDRSISGAVSTTQKRAEAVKHRVKNYHSVNVWGIPSRLRSATTKSMIMVRIAK